MVEQTPVGVSQAPSSNVARSTVQRRQLGGPGKSLTRTSGFDPTFLVREDINGGGPSCDCCLSVALNSHTVKNGPGTCRAAFGAQFENQVLNYVKKVVQQENWQKRNPTYFCPEQHVQQSGEMELERS